MKNINLDRFDGHYALEFARVKDGETLLTLDFATSEMQDGTMQESVTDFTEKIVNPERVVISIGEDSGTECNIFINGIIVKDINKELGI